METIVEEEKKHELEEEEVLEEQNKKEQEVEERLEKRGEEEPQHQDIETRVGSAEAIGNKSDKTLVNRARKLLSRRMRVGVEDGRYFIGKFHCLDKQGNIILSDTTECREVCRTSKSEAASSSAQESKIVEERNLGLVLIPAKRRTSCQIECSLAEQFSLLAL